MRVTVGADRRDLIGGRPGEVMFAHEREVIMGTVPAGPSSQSASKIAVSGGGDL